jgi:hypothetical protein
VLRTNLLIDHLSIKTNNLNKIKMLKLIKLIIHTFSAKALATTRIDSALALAIFAIASASP